MTTLPIISWFEIPAVNYDRAIQFYEQVFNVNLKREETDGMAMAIFPHADAQSAGAVVSCEAYKPNANGVCIYLYTTEFDAALQRVEKSGGKVAMPKMSIGPNGFIAHFIDTEGNRVGLHTNP